MLIHVWYWEEPETNKKKRHASSRTVVWIWAYVLGKHKHLPRKKPPAAIGTGTASVRSDFLSDQQFMTLGHTEFRTRIDRIRTVIDKHRIEWSSVVEPPALAAELKHHKVPCAVFIIMVLFLDPDVTQGRRHWLNVTS